MAILLCSGLGPLERAVVSYGIFLWHVPLFGWLIGADYSTDRGLSPSSPLVRGLPAFVSDHVLVAALGSTLLLSVGAAALSYYVVELPFLRLKERRLLAFFRRTAGEPEPRPVLPTPPG